MTQELLDIVDENNIPLGKTKLRSEVHLTKTDWHRTVDIWIVNKAGQLLCQQRSWKKDGNPGKWMSYVGGHMKAGQTVEECVRDELMEELGLDIGTINEQPIFVGMGKSDTEKHFSYRYVLKWDGDIEKDIVFSDGEVEQVRWMSIAAIESEIKEGIFCNIINDVIREYLNSVSISNVEYLYMHQKIQFSYKEKLIELSYIIRSGNNKTILFLHGLGASGQDFQNAFNDKSLGGYTLISFDFPGHGNSPYVANLEMEDLAEITKCFTKALKIHNFYLVGHSMGGVVGLLYAQKYTTDIKAFINIEGGLTGADCNFSRFISRLDYAAFETQYGSSNRGMYNFSRSLVDYSTSGNLLELYMALKVPTLYVSGSESIISCIDELSSSGCNLAKISKSDHHPFLTSPAEFYSVVSIFLSTIY